MIHRHKSLSQYLSEKGWEIRKEDKIYRIYDSNNIIVTGRKSFQELLAYIIQDSKPKLQLNHLLIYK
jgi:hypothetical protein